MSLGYFLRMARFYGPSYTLKAIYHAKIHHPIKEHRRVRRLVEGKHGIEVGGPSDVFGPRGVIPLYDAVGSLDNCNFSSETWWAKHEAGRTFKFSEAKAPGVQFVMDGATLPEITDGSYEFVLSCHMLEHVANPLKALANWRRVLAPGGVLVLLVPYKKHMYDHRRPTTTMQHLIEDFEADRGEDDATHFPEIMELLDFMRTPDMKETDMTREQIVALLDNNAQTRIVHHHVFEPPLVRQVVEHAGFSILLLRAAFSNHIVCVAVKQLVL
jgi:SAM-dependent methyltransferase